MDAYTKRIASHSLRHMLTQEQSNADPISTQWPTGNKYSLMWHKFQNQGLTGVTKLVTIWSQGTQSLYTWRLSIQLAISLSCLAHCSVRVWRECNSVSLIWGRVAQKRKLYIVLVSACKYDFVRFQVLTAANMKMNAFCDIPPCSHVKVDRRFRCALFIHRLNGGGSKLIIVQLPPLSCYFIPLIHWHVFKSVTVQKMIK
jgi:hypothetical protein